MAFPLPFFPNRAPDTRFGYFAILFLEYFCNTDPNAFFITPTTMGCNLTGLSLQELASNGGAQTTVLRFRFNNFLLALKLSCNERRQY